MRKTKIICTIGPASKDEEVLRELIDNGMQIARLNFSHGLRSEHGEILERIRDISDDIGVMMDTQGPEVRLGEVERGTVLAKGDIVELVKGEVTGDKEALPVDYPGLIKRLEEGDDVLLADGEVELIVEEVNDRAKCRVVYGGKVSSRKSINLPGKDVGLSSPTEKDREDIEYAAEHGFDFIAASFVKQAQDIEDIRELLGHRHQDIKIIAKIEHLKAVENIDQILNVSDGIMIARGDLGVEVPASDVPLLQKRIIEKCNRREKPVIVATQMLQSMTESPRATRAEVSDVANAVRDGADAVMLSEETAIGRYPVKTAQFMSEVLEKMEGFLKGTVHHTIEESGEDTADIISKSVWQASRETEAVDAKYIVAHTSSGYTANKIAKYRPDTDIIAFTDSKRIQRQLNLVWGVTPFFTEFPEHVDEMVCSTARFLYQRSLVNKSDKLIITAGVPQPVHGITNMMEIRTVQSLIKEAEGSL